jgi:large subunit ribosomal protein L23
MAEDRTKVAAASVKDYGLLLSPVITEKTSTIGKGGRVVTVLVDPRATKNEVKGAIERVFSVKVESIRTLTAKGKTKRTARGVGKLAGSKRAYVKLAEGSKIDFVEGV